MGGRRQQVTESGLGHHDGDLLKALRSGEVLVRYGYLLLLLLLVVVLVVVVVVVVAPTTA